MAVQDKTIFLVGGFLGVGNVQRYETAHLNLHEVPLLVAHPEGRFTRSGRLVITPKARIRIRDVYTRRTSPAEIAVGYTVENIGPVGTTYGVYFTRINDK